MSEVILHDEASGNLAVLVPARGGLLTRLRLAGDELLYLDEETLRDPTRNVRGGVPILFPSPGRLQGDTWSRDGRGGRLPQHGFARNLPWRVAETGGAAVTLELTSNDFTRAAFPWDFACRFRYLLDGDALRIVQEIENRSATPMPFALGFHPYFAVPQAAKAGTRIDTRATRAWDNVTKQIVELDGIDLTRAEVDLHLIDHGSTASALRRPDRTRAVHLDASPEFGRWVIWTLAGRDFVCLEPWTAPADALNSGDRLLVLAPGEMRTLELTIAYLVTAPAAG